MTKQSVVLFSQEQKDQTLEAISAAFKTSLNLGGNTVVAAARTVELTAGVANGAIVGYTAVVTVVTELVPSTGEEWKDMFSLEEQQVITDDTPPPVKED